MKKQQTFFDFAAEVGLTKHIGGIAATEALIELCHIGRESTILDVGCGTGRHAVELAAGNLNFQDPADAMTLADLAAGPEGDLPRVHQFGALGTSDLTALAERFNRATDGALVAPGDFFRHHLDRDTANARGGTGEITIDQRRRT